LSQLVSVSRFCGATLFADAICYNFTRWEGHLNVTIFYRRNFCGAVRASCCCGGGGCGGGGLSVSGSGGGGGLSGVGGVSVCGGGGGGVGITTDIIGIVYIQLLLY